MRETLKHIWRMRNDPNGVIRLGWWGVIAVFLSLLISRGAVGDALRQGWALFNLALFGYTMVRALACTRGVLRGAGAAFRWAFWGSLISFFAINLAASKFLTVFATRLSIPASLTNYGLLLGLLGAPIVFVALFIVSLIGAAFGVVNTRDRSEQTAAATAGVARFWFGVILVVLLMAAGRVLHLPDKELQAVPLGLPTFLALLGLRNASSSNWWDLGDLGRFLSRWCIVRTKSPRRIVYLDLRGPLLGLLAGVVVLALNTLTVLEPLQSAELLEIVRMQSISFENEGLNAGAEKMPARIVLLNMDERTRQQIAKEGSEAKTQAALIRRLKKLGALRVVMSPPAAQPPDEGTRFLNLGIASEPDHPPLKDQVIQRSNRDLPELIAAMKAAGNVVLSVPANTPFAPPPPENEGASQPSTVKGAAPQAPAAPPVPASTLPPALRPAASEVGFSDLPAFNHPQLPMVPLDSAPLPSLPLALYLAATGEKAHLPNAPGDSRGYGFPVIQPQRVLVTFPSPRAGITFPKIDYSTVLAGREIYDRKLVPGEHMLEDKGAWTTPETFFKGKIVFLDSVLPAYRESPLGLMPQAELLALATRTLFSRDAVRAVPAVWQILLTLLLSAFVGWLCAGRDPFGAGWRVAMAGGILATGAAVMGLFDRTWLDVAAPLLACAGTYLMVTQLTYTTNESDRDLLRRFAAPQVVEELLRRPELPALGGSRQRLCVLFADVRGFTSFTEQHRDQPERVIETINAYTSAMTEALFQFKGILDKYTGDGLMAFFTIDEGEDQSVAVQRSVHAALAMRDATEKVTAQLREADLQPLHVGIGMHYGEAVVGLVGNLNQFNYTALGYTVVVAARLQTLASGGEVIVSTEINDLIRDEFQTEALPPVEVKGVSEAVTPYRVIRPRPAMSQGEVPSQLAAGSVHGEP